MGETKHKECFINDESCKGKIKEAHILSRAATMSQLCGPGKGGLCVIKLGSQPEEVGWSKASAYHCFCDVHDTQIFLPIEGDNEFDVESDQQVFLHIFRSFAYAYHIKRSELIRMENLFGDLLKGFGVITDYEISESQQMQLYPYDRIRDKLLDTWKSQKLQSNLKVSVFILDGAFPVASAGVLMAEIIGPSNLGYNLVNYDSNEPLLAQPGLILTVLPAKEDKTVIILAALSGDANAVHTIKKVDELGSNLTNLTLAVSGLMLSSNKENTFLHPKLWEFMQENGDHAKIIEDLNTSRGTDLLTDQLWIPQTNLFDIKYSCKNLGITPKTRN